MKNFIIATIAIFTALHSGAQNFTELCDEGKKVSREGNYRLAAELFLQAADAAKNNNERIFALSSRGHALRVTGDREKAAKSYAQALAIDSTQVELLAQMGNIMLECDSVSAAIDCYNRILQQEPRNRGILLFRAYAHTLAGNFKEAKIDYLKTISLNNNDKEARLGLALLYQKEGNTNDCLMMLETLIDEHPNDAELHVARCNIEREQQQPELALQDIDKAIELSPQKAEYHFIRAELLQKMGKRQAAQKSRATANRLAGTPE